MVEQLLRSLKATIEYFGGVTERSPLRRYRWLEGPMFWGLWWAFLILLILCFSGQASKFIYIDF